MENRWKHCSRGPHSWAHVPLEVGVGALVLVGGGGTPPSVHDLFFHLAGGPAGRVIHIPSATGKFDEIEDKRAYYCEFYARNPASFAFLTVADLAPDPLEGYPIWHLLARREALPKIPPTKSGSAIPAAPPVVPLKTEDVGLPSEHPLARVPGTLSHVRGRPTDNVPDAPEPHPVSTLSLTP
jgi:hypothetical protein